MGRRGRLSPAAAGHQPRRRHRPHLGLEGLLARPRRILYGKLLRSKPTLVSLDLLPTLYALSPNYGDLEDYLLQYEDGRLSVEAKNVYEALLAEGALSTSRLRQVAGLSGGGVNARR